MAKTPSDRLFRLIHSLSKQERRYFTIWVQGKADRPARYLQLFDSIFRQTELDEAALMAVVYKNEPIGSRKFSELKAYLFDLILKSLEAFDEKSSVEFRLRHQLQAMSVLFKRGLYSDCRELLEKARRLAERYENFPTLLEILRWEKQLAYSLTEVDLLAREVQRIDYQEDRCLRQLKNLAEYRRLFFEVWASARTESAARRDDRLEKLHLLAQNPMLKNVDEALSHKARVLFFRAKSIHHYLTLEYDSFYETGRQLLDLQESQPHFLGEDLSEYIAALSNFILACGLQQRYEEVAATLEKLEKLVPITHDDRVKITRQYFSGRFNFCVFTGDFELGRREMARLRDEWAHLDPRFFESASSLFQYFSIAFGCGDYDDALDYLNRLLAQPRRTLQRQDLQSISRILNLILHFEMENMELLESLLRSSYRYLRSKNRMFDIEKAFISLMSELLRMPSKNEQTEVFLRQKGSFLHLFRLPAGKILLQYFDLESWLEHKISGKTFAEAVREKYQKTKR